MKNKQKKYKLVLNEMKKIYYAGSEDLPTYNLDWMGCEIDEYNYPTYHHITKASELREKNENDIATLENGAYLGTQSHESLHYIETFDPKLYNAWNKMFLYINKTNKHPDKETWNNIFDLLNISIIAIENHEKNKKRNK